MATVSGTRRPPQPRMKLPSVPALPPVEESPQKLARKVKTNRNGQGSVFQRSRKLRSGEVTTYWLGQLMVGYTSEGRRDLRYVTAATEDKAREKLDQLRAELSPWTTRADLHRLTVGEFLARWIDASRSTWRPRTYERYVEVAELYVLPSLARVKLRELDPEKIQRLYGQLSLRLAPLTVRKVHALLRRALGQGVKWGAVARNAAAVVDPPRAPRNEIPPPTLDEARALLDAAAAADDRLLALWTLAIFTGCRQGELLALKWTDVDVDRGTLAVRRTLERIRDGEPVFGEPKSKTSRRTVVLGPAAVELLRVHRARQNEEQLAAKYYARNDLVFATEAGTPLPPRNVVRRFKQALARGGIRGSVRFHDLRHLSATIMLLAGIHPKVASGRLGHSTIGITQDLYTHMVAGLDADAAQRIEETMAGAIGGGR